MIPGMLIKRYNWAVVAHAFHPKRERVQSSEPSVLNGTGDIREVSSLGWAAGAGGGGALFGG